jgi:hypothetical protein
LKEFRRGCANQENDQYPMPPHKPYGENIPFIPEGKMHRKEDESMGQNEATNAASTRSLLRLSCE